MGNPCSKMNPPTLFVDNRKDKSTAQAQEVQKTKFNKVFFENSCNGVKDPKDGHQVCKWVPGLTDADSEQSFAKKKAGDKQAKIEPQGCVKRATTPTAAPGAAPTPVPQPPAATKTHQPPAATKPHQPPATKQPHQPPATKQPQ